MARKKNIVARSQQARVITVVERYQKVFSGVDGQWVLHDLMDKHNLMSSTLNKDGSVDIAKEGERTVVLRILSLLQTDVAELRERIEKHVEVLND